MAHRKARRKVKNEKIKNKAERIRQQEELEAERQAKKAQRRRRMNREDFNIEVQENSGETPYVEETVFRKKPLILETKKREPIFDFVKENGAEVAVRREEKTEDAPKEAHDEKAAETPSIREAAAMPAEDVRKEAAEEQVKPQATESDAADALFAEIFAEKPREESIRIDILPGGGHGQNRCAEKGNARCQGGNPHCNDGGGDCGRNAGRGSGGIRRSGRAGGSEACGRYA